MSRTTKAESQRIWRLIDPETGDFEDFAGCPKCEEREAALVQLERQHRTVNARLTRLQGDEEKKAREHKLWAEAEAAHEWWRLATGHEGVSFGAEEFYAVLPRLKERNGLQGVLKAIAGAAYDPSTKRMKNGDLMVYDDWELLNRSKAKAHSFHRRVYGSERTEKWKLWLLERIESNLREGNK